MVGWIRGNRRVGTALAGAALAVGAMIVTAGPAAAEGSHEECGPFLRLPDNGPLADPIHHGVEPILPALQPTIHRINCDQVSFLEYAVTPGYVQDAIDLANHIVSGGTIDAPLLPPIKLPVLLPGFKLPGGRG